MTAKEECSRIGESLPEYLAGRVSASEEARIRAHLEVCAECRGRANAVSLLQQTPVPSPDPDRWNFFVKGVVSEAERSSRLVTPRRVWWFAAALAAAAALIFTCSRVATAEVVPHAGTAWRGEAPMMGTVPGNVAIRGARNPEAGTHSGASRSAGPP